MHGDGAGDDAGEPPTQTNGGASTHRVRGNGHLGYPIAPGQASTVQFLFVVEQIGAYHVQLVTRRCLAVAVG